MRSAKTLTVTALIAVALTSFEVVAQQHPPELGETLERRELVETVLARNPNITVAYGSIRAMRARVDVAGALDDPRLSVGLAPLTLDDSSIGSSIELSQEIPWPGRLGARQDVVRAGVSMETANLEELRIDLALRASMLYDRWYVLHRALEVNTHHRDLVEQMKSSAESQYVVGNAAQQDPLQAEVRITRLLKERTELEADVRVVRAAMNTLMHREPAAAIPPPLASLEAPSPIVPETVSGGQPAVIRARASIERAEAELRLAELEKRPDVMAMGQFSSMWMNDDHRLMTGVSLRLPVRKSRIDASIRAARAELESRIAMLDAIEYEVNNELRESIYELESHLATLALYENLLVPASRDQTEAAQTGFSTGRNSFLAVLDAENNLHEVLLGYHMILGQAWGAAANAIAARGDVPFAEMEWNDE